MSPDKMSRTKCRGQNVMPHTIPSQGQNVIGQNVADKMPWTKCRGQNVVVKISRIKCRGQNVVNKMSW